MIKRGRRAQIQLSFGMIFSIIIIIVTLLVAGYIIIKFLNSQSNAQCKIYYQKLQDTIDDAWKGDGSSIDVRNEPFPQLPEDVERICFGNSSQGILSQSDRNFFDDVSFYTKRENNLFFYPSGSCGSGGSAYTLNHAVTPGFFCSEVRNDKLGIRIMKDKKDALVTICDITSPDCG